MFGFPYLGFSNFYRKPYYHTYPRHFSNNLNTSSFENDLSSNISSSNLNYEDTVSTNSSNTVHNISATDMNNDRSSSQKNPNNSYFFELFGLKLYFDDILIICLLYFLYSEGVKDEGLFIALILLLIT